MSDEPENVDLATPDLAADKRAAFEDLFPGVLADGVLDATRLGELLDTDVTAPADGRERYGLMWAGKHEAVQSLLTPSRGTLVPDLEKSVDFDNAENIFIEGDNFEVLKLLQKSYNDKIKLVYIDPPYNTGNDFIYNDDFSDGLRRYLEYTGQIDPEGKRVSSATEVAGRRHSAWLSMLYPRLVLARNLLRQDGVIFVSIDDNEVMNLKAAMDEVFGMENHLGTFIWKSKSGGANDSGQVAVDHEYLLAYERSASGEALGLDPGAVASTSYNHEDSHGRYSLERLDKQNLQYSASMDYELIGPNGESYLLAHRDPVRPNAIWRWSKEKVQREMDQLVFKGGHVYTKNYQKVGGKPRSLLVDDRFGRTRTGSTEVRDVLGGSYFDNPKPTKLLTTLIAIGTSPDDIVLDFFAGSGSTAHAVHLQNVADGGHRRCVSVNLPERTGAGSAAEQAGFSTVADITWQRIRNVMDDVEGAYERGLRFLSLSGSNFRDPADVDPDDLSSLSESTLVDENFDSDAVATEVLLKEGVTLDASWERHAVADGEVVVSGGIAVVVALKLDDEAVERVLDLEPRVVVFLEDGFAEADPVKANAYASAKSRGITMKTV